MMIIILTVYIGMDDDTIAELAEVAQSMGNVTEGIMAPSETEEETAPVDSANVNEEETVTTDEPAAETTEEEVAAEEQTTEDEAAAGDEGAANEDEAAA